MVFMVNRAVGWMQCIHEDGGDGVVHACSDDIALASASSLVYHYILVL